MKLYLNKTSPYARLVHVVVHEKNLDAEVERVWVDPWGTPPELLVASPFSKVPVLIARDELPLIESTSICDYLDEVGGGRGLLPKEGDGRLKAMRKLGLGRGLIDAAFGVTLERRFHDKNNPSELAVRWLAAVNRAVEHLRPEGALGNPGTPDLGDLCVAVGLSYTRFRLPEVAWAAGAPELAKWVEAVEARPSFKATEPE
jgi:glutathione S-transferase